MLCISQLKGGVALSTYIREKNVLDRPWLARAGEPGLFC